MDEVVKRNCKCNAELLFRKMGYSKKNPADTFNPYWYQAFCKACKTWVYQT